MSSLVWNYFGKTPNKPKYATCNLCDKEYSCRTTTTNLKKHLKFKHLDVFEALLNAEKNIKSSSNVNQNKPKKYGQQRSSIWDIFKRIPENPQNALCMLCSGEYSCKTSVTNLKTHLMRKHEIAYQNLYNRESSEHEDGSNSRFKGTSGNLTAHLRRHHVDALEKNKEDVASNDEVALESDEEIDSLHGKDIYFEEVDDEVKCTVCGKNISDAGEDPREHLEEHHPALLAKIIKNEDREEEEEEEARNEKDIFTEVVYLDPVSPSQTKKPKPQTKKPSINQRKRKLSTNSDEPLVKCKNVTEIETFTNYIRVLLEKLPQDVCSRLQLEIIGLIMAAKLNLPSNSAAVPTAVAGSITITSGNHYVQEGN